MAGNRIGSNEHPPGVREKRATLHTAILQGVAVLFYSTPFVLTHYIPLKLGKYFSSYALTARWVHFLFVEKWRPLLSVRYVRSLPLPRPTAPKFGSHPNFRRRSKSPCTLIERTMVQGSGACEKSVGSHRSSWQRR